MEKRDSAYYEKILKDNLKLFVRGITYPEDFKEPIHLQSEFGGTGPQGKGFWIYSHGKGELKTNKSVQLYPKSHYLAQYALPTRLYEAPYTFITDEDGIILESIPFPKFWHEKIDGMEIWETSLAKLHSYKTLAVGPWTTCRNFEGGQECKYCTLYLQDQRWDRLGLPKLTPNEKIAELIRIVEENDQIRSITIAGGTFGDTNDVVKEYIKMAQEIRKVSDVSINVQFEPLDDLSLLVPLRDAGVDSIACSLEIFDERVRKEICPGKARVSQDEYLRTWKEAANVFGRGNVLSFCLLGFDEDYAEVLNQIQQCAELGVKTNMILARVGSRSIKEGYIPSYYEKENELYDLHIKAAEAMVNNLISFQVGEGSGCIGCAGCTVMVEACNYVRSLKG